MRVFLLSFFAVLRPSVLYPSSAFAFVRCAVCAAVPSMLFFILLCRGRFVFRRSRCPPWGLGAFRLLVSFFPFSVRPSVFRLCRGWLFCFLLPGSWAACGGLSVVASCPALRRLFVWKICRCFPLVGFLHCCCVFCFASLFLRWFRGVAAVFVLRPCWRISFFLFFRSRADFRKSYYIILYLPNLHVMPSLI